MVKSAQPEHTWLKCWFAANLVHLRLGLPLYLFRFPSPHPSDSSSLPQFLLNNAQNFYGPFDSQKLSQKVKTSILEPLSCGTGTSPPQQHLQGEERYQRSSQSSSCQEQGVGELEQRGGGIVHVEARGSADV